MSDAINEQIENAKNRVYVPNKWDIWVHQLIKDKDPSKLRNLIYMFFPFGLFIWWKSKKVFEKERTTLNNIIRDNTILGSNLVRFNAEHDGTILYIYYYASDEMLSWKDSQVISSAKTFMHNMVYRHFIDDGAGTMFSDSMELVSRRIPLDALGEMRGYAQSDELRHVVIKVYPTYLGTPEAVWMVTMKSLKLFGIIATSIIAILAFVMFVLI
jgi:hypothetical protein